MKKILFLIHDLEHGGAEKVLVNLVNNMDKTKFDITVMTLFDVGVNKQFLSPQITYKTCFSKMIRGNSHFMKLFTPEQLHRMFIKEEYDIEIAYLEGPCARIISGCPNKETTLISWIHCTMKTEKDLVRGFRNIEEVKQSYNNIDTVVFVSEGVRNSFLDRGIAIKQDKILFNTNESESILKKSKEPIDEKLFPHKQLRWCGVGKVVKNKGFDRMLHVQKKLIEDGYDVQFYIIGTGPEQKVLETWCGENGLSEKVTFMGYQTNPYKYVAKCDLFVCASYAEGFSTAATESLIVGTPVCTVEVSGMHEMLGNNEYGLIVENNEEALYHGIKRLIEEPELLRLYKKQAVLRGKDFSTEKTVEAVEKMLLV